MNERLDQSLAPMRCVGMQSVYNASDLTIDHMIQARERIAPHIHKTPILTSEYLNNQTKAELFFKCENFQKAGAFKTRGACNAVFGLIDDYVKFGVATHSSGNHALSLAYAANRRGIPCNVVMPKTAPIAKKDAVVSKIFFFKFCGFCLAVIA